MSEGFSHSEQAGARQFALPSIVAAAHELKTPLAIMRQLALAIQEGGASDAEIRQMAERIGLTSERALRLTHDLTRGNRLQEVLFELEPLDVMPLCKDVVSELEPLYRARGQRLEWKTRQHALPLVIAHRDLLRRVMANFLDNALYYGEVSRPVELSATYRRRDDVIRLGVRDYGPGMERSTTRSFTKPRAISYRPQSSGLGLYLAGQFAEAMQARIGTIQHRDGATFYVDVNRSHQMRLL